MCKFSGPDKLVLALVPKIFFFFFFFFFFRFFSELVSMRPAYIANKIRGPQSARSNGTDLYKLLASWSKRRFLKAFPHYKSVKAYDPLSVDILDPSDIDGRIYV